ncbi:hypothetical protein B7P43_G02721 [Cryptotermes secundus]|uniref:Endonuclease/exonuclease/phosphatase domain-containing protein n=1 Tax=Cryptotermes secundus TaxID=105785 RepID=A0A2J7RQH4_9NEOP|nr:hypothetical protein B7P43_G02721 [Cryptotermes secundus]
MDIQFRTWDLGRLYKAGSLMTVTIVSAVKRVEFVSDKVQYIVLRGRWCDIISLNVNAPTEDTIYDMKESFYEEVESVISKFPKYNTKILLGYFKAKVVREDIFKPTIGNDSLQEIVKIMELLTVKSTMFPPRNIHRFLWTSDGKTHNQIDHILIERRRH